VTQRSSFDHVASWLKDIRAEAESDVVTVLIGNKTDLVESRQVATEEGAQLAASLNMAFYEVSAKAGDNINSAIVDCLTSITAMIEAGKVEGKSNVDALVLDKEDEEIESKCC
jgi:GTPase SAR1 family protein